MEFKFLTRLVLKFRAIVPLLGASSAWAAMYLFAWWLGMPLASISQVAGPIGLAGAVVGWMIDLRWGVTTRLYRDHFEHRRDLAELLYETGQIPHDDALNLYYAASLELIVAQESALFAPRRATRRLKQRRWVIESVLPLLWNSDEFTEPHTLMSWRDLVEELVDCYLSIQSTLSLKARITGPGMDAAKAVVALWEQRRIKHNAALRTLQPRRVVGLLPAPTPPLLDAVAMPDDAVPVVPIK